MNDGLKDLPNLPTRWRALSLIFPENGPATLPGAILACADELEEALAVEQGNLEARDRQWAEAVLGLAAEVESGISTDRYGEAMRVCAANLHALVERMKNGESSPDGGEGAA